MNSETSFCVFFINIERGEYKHIWKQITSTKYIEYYHGINNSLERPII